MGYHYTAEGSKKGLGGDILGFDKYLQATIKINPDEAFELPKFYYFEAVPFVFMSSALAPNRAATTANWREYIRASAGVGVTFLSKTISNALAIECYLNLFVHKQKNEL